MRLLSEEEKKICLKISERKDGSVLLPKIIMDFVPDAIISLDRKRRQVLVSFPIEDFKDVDLTAFYEQCNNITRLILITCNLINLLEKEGYILIYQTAYLPLNDESIYSRTAEDKGHSEGLNLEDKRIRDLFIDYVDKEIITTPEFDRFCKKGFIARDEQRFKRQIGLAYAAFSVALIAALTNLGFNISNKLSGGTKIKQEQIDTLTRSLNRIEVAIENKDSFFNNQSNSDSVRNHD